VTGGQTLGWAGGNKACQVREERLAVLGAPVPGLGHNSSAVDEEGAYTGVQVRAWLSK
jgi:hypothetical protein